MRCMNCGFESDGIQRFCPICGKDLQPENPPQNAATGPILNVLRNTMFLIICILISVCCILSLSTGSIPLINILLAVFLWLTYAKAYKGQLDVSCLRNVSGTVFANYVINYVIAGLVALVGLILAAGITMIVDSPDLLNEILDGMALDSTTEAMVTQFITGVPASFLMILFLIIAAAIAVINFFCMHNIHRFAKSVYCSVQSNRLALEHANTAKIWLFIIGVCSCVSAVSSLSSGNLISGLSNGCAAAAAILAGILISRLSAPAPQGPQAPQM